MFPTLPPELANAGPYYVIGIFAVYVVRRLNKVEKALYDEIQARGRIALLLERACHGYEAVRRELVNLVSSIRGGGTPSEVQLAELEATPNIEIVLRGVLGDKAGGDVD